MTCTLCRVRTAQPPHGLCVMCRAITVDTESPRVLDPAGWVKGKAGIWRHRDVRGGRAVRA